LATVWNSTEKVELAFSVTVDAKSYSMPIDGLPPQLQERVACSISAAAKYQVPANIILAIAEKEGGRPGRWSPNKNGTHDVGSMQFNTAYLADLARYEITANDVTVAGCYSFDLAAWRLRQHLRKDKGDLWTRAANYHSRTPRYNNVYRADLMRKATKWADWLDARFVTYDTVKPSATQQVMDHRQEVMPKAKIQAKEGLVAVPEKLQPHGPKASYMPRMLITKEQLPEMR
jgi:hypothetical protein